MSEAPAPFPSATVMLLRDRPEGFEVFMVVRHHNIEFAGGALVFPGGRFDAEDSFLAEKAERCVPVAGEDVQALTGRVAAIRETYEECGVLLARPRGREALIAAERVNRLDPSLPLLTMLEQEDLILATDLLVPYAHWITPPFERKRFETWFYLVRAPEDQVGLHDGHETVDSIWISPHKALADTRAKIYQLIFPTRLNLEKVSRHTTIEALFDQARKDPIVPCMPMLVEGDGTLAGAMTLRIPLEAGYGGEVFPAW